MAMSPIDHYHELQVQNRKLLHQRNLALWFMLAAFVWCFYSLSLVERLIDKQTREREWVLSSLSNAVSQAYRNLEAKEVPSSRKSP